MDGKDVEIIEAHLYDVATSTRILLKGLGRRGKSIDPDPMLSISSMNEHRIDSESLTRLADNIFFTVIAQQPEACWEDTTKVVLVRFIKNGIERRIALRRLGWHKETVIVMLTTETERRIVQRSRPTMAAAMSSKSCRR